MGGGGWSAVPWLDSKNKPVRGTDFVQNLINPQNLGGLAGTPQAETRRSEAVASDIAGANVAAVAEVQAAKEGAAAQAKAAISERRRRVTSGSQTVYTSPLGLSGGASLARKSLLGQ